MKHLAKRDNAVQAKAAKNAPDIYPGDRFIDDDGYVYLVKKVQATKDGEGCITYGCAYDLTDPDTRTTDFEHFLSGKYLKVDGTGTPEEIEAAMFAKALQLKHTDEEDGEQGPASGSREIATCLDKGALISMQKAIEERKRNVEIVRRFVEGKRNELRNILSEYSKQVEKIQSVLITVELYLGISEDILQFAAGEPAPADTPIIFRQQVLYMDEEVGDPEGGGLDKHDVDNWDKWVLQNLAKVLPEPKGIVMFKPRRYDKHYSNNRLENYFANQGNFKTYVLIRNGGNIYRIWTLHEVGEQVFPSRKDMEKINRVLEKGSDGRGSYFDERDAEKAMLEYKRTMLLFQGLLDRTQIFAPIKPGIMLNKPQTYLDGCVKFIYDNEPALGTGHKSYAEWRKECNAKIVRGTRVYFTGQQGHDYKEWSHHHNMRYGNYTIPAAGVYSVKYMLDEKTGVAIYKSPDEVYVRDYYYKGLESCYQPRKRGEGFKIYQSSSEIINYDMLSFADIEYFLQDRYERRNYLEMMPVLYGLRKERLAELEWEKGFVTNLVLRLGHADSAKAEAATWQAIEWWKRKVIWKRPIMKEDAKALRMITSRVRRVLGIKGGK